MMESPNKFTGSLKQQCLDESGLYEWVRKDFTLKIEEGSLEIFPNAHKNCEPQSSLSLTAARHAKEWSISSAVAGYGFDIVWASGKMWSFLADNEGACQSWVLNINKSIKICVQDLHKAVDLAVNKSGKDFRNILGIPKVFDDDESRYEGRYEGRNESKYDYLTGDATGATGATGRKQDIDTYHEMISKLPMGKLPTEESRRRYAAANAPNTNNAAYINAAYAGNDNDITAEFQSPVRGKNAYTGPGGRDPPTVPRYSSNAPASNTAAAAGTGATGLAARNQSTHASDGQPSQSSRGRMDISDIPVVDSASDRSSPQAPSLTDDEKESLHEEKSNLAEAKRIRFVGSGLREGQGGGQGGQGVGSVDHHDLHNAEELEVSALRLRCNQLTLTAECDRAEAEKVRRQVLILQEELQESFFTLEKNAHALRQRERESYQAAQLETHAKILRATDERDILHEADMRAAQEQYSREMASLRDEFTEARKRYGEELSKVSALRDASEGREMELMRENNSIRDANSRLTADRVRAAESSHIDAASWNKERESIIAAADARIAALEDEREALIARGQSEMSAKINELTLKFGASTTDMERTVRETMIQEMAAEKIREIAAMQKKCSRDVQVARTDERRLAGKEVETVRSFFLEREAQTAEDLSELEKLHDGRIARLEQQLAVSKKRAATAEDNLDVAVREIDKGAEGTKSTTGKYFKQLEESARKADVLSEELEAAHSELQESRVREGVYREQLARVLEDARVKNAMLLEAQRQASEGSSQAYQWRKAVAVRDSNQTATTTKLQISRDEISMLEHDLKRLKIENAGLRNSLEKAEMLVYGTVQQAHAQQETGGSKRPKSAPGSGNMSLIKQRGSMASLSVSRSGLSHGGTDGAGGSPGYGAGGAGGGRASHPPWRSGMCNCNCKASWCRCMGHGASVTS